MYLKFVLLLLGISGGTWSATIGSNVQDSKSTANDLATAETSAKLLNLFGSGSGYGYPNYGSNYRPSTGYYPGYNGYNPYPGSVNGYYGSSSGYYGSNSAGYYPNSGSYYPNSGSYYPSTNSYYPSTGSYYPSTNILGSQGGYGGYGGYGGNGGLRQYSGYWQPNYMGQRNRGYGYYDNTDRFGLPSSARNRDYYGTGLSSSSSTSLSGYSGGYRRGYD